MARWTFCLRDLKEVAQNPVHCSGENQLTRPSPDLIQKVQIDAKFVYVRCVGYWYRASIPVSPVRQPPCYHADFFLDPRDLASVPVRAAALSAWVSLRRLRPSGCEFHPFGLADE